MYGLFWLAAEWSSRLAECLRNAQEAENECVPFHGSPSFHENSLHANGQNITAFQLTTQASFGNVIASQLAGGQFTQARTYNRASPSKCQPPSKKTEQSHKL